MSRVILGLAVLFALGGCAHATSKPVATGLEHKVDRGLGGGLHAVSSATGTMDLGLASAATAIPSETLAPFLGQHGFQGGYSRVWQRGSEVVTSLGYHFFAERDADALVALARELLPTSHFYEPLVDPLVPGGFGYQLVSRVNATTKFCVGEWFTVQRDAFVVTHCAEYPLPTSAATELAQRQLVYAVTGSETP